MRRFLSTFIYVQTLKILNDCAQNMHEQPNKIQSFFDMSIDTGSYVFLNRYFNKKYNFTTKLIG